MVEQTLRALVVVEYIPVRVPVVAEVAGLALQIPRQLVVEEAVQRKKAF